MLKSVNIPPYSYNNILIVCLDHSMSVLNHNIAAVIRCN